jgi:ABC-type nitrate/sulfonate/bicarbonate transport system substrate-binding protein
VAVEAGFFARNGLEVSLAQVEANAQVASVLSGEIPYAFTGAAQTANADVGGADLVMVATSADLPVFSLYAQPRYETVQALVGQSIGITSPGTATEAAARLFLRHYGLEGQVTVTPSGGSQPSILAAIGQGLIAGGILAPPVTTAAARQGLRELVNGTSLGVPMNITGLVLTRRYLRDHQGEVRRFLAAYQQAWTFCADPANESAVVAAIARYTQSSVEDAQTGYEAMRPVIASKPVPTEDPEAVRNVLAVSPNPQVASTDPTSLIDNSILESLRSSDAS